ncbi:DMT family transporter [Paracoccus siganidrum]|uniref:DMT family transporter n=1 Tax=Paracoccus siganidrum TaxID=1276757 RepID=A0A418ZX27_9RHOB|nr:DMT family transporter [Paracoccus siganidrum]RJL05071.1 DMT family transporter [Paracoccus siganidrum]RMC26509.1 ABC transporter permease [Paracoccus siganidrum]
MSGQDRRLALGLMLLAAVMAGLDAVIVRTLAGGVHPLVIAFFRAFFGLMVVLPWIVARVDLAASPYRGLHVLRAALKQASLVAIFLAFTHAPLADATAITFTTPIFLTLGAWFFLNERIDPARAIAILSGFAGILIIIRPAGGSFDPWLLCALAGAILTAVIQLVLRRMTRLDSADRLVAWNLLAMVPLGLLGALPVWVTPTPAQLLLLAAQGLVGALNMSLITRAFSLAEASFLAPLDYLRLPAVAVLAFLFFDEFPPWSTWAGAAVIILGTVIASRGGIMRRR